MTRKFHGTYEALQDRVNLTGCLGRWRDLGNHKQFIANDGAVLNWWESSHTLFMQGREPQKTSLEDSFRAWDSFVHAHDASQIPGRSNNTSN